MGALAALATIIWFPTPSAHGGGTDWVFDEATYRSGDRGSAWAQIDRSLVKKKGYTDKRVPYYAFAVPWDSQTGSPVAADGTLRDDAVRLGRVKLQRGAPEGTRAPGPDHFSMTFSVPELPPGRYAVLECNVPCRRPLPFNTGGSFEVVAA